MFFVFQILGAVLLLYIASWVLRLIEAGIRTFVYLKRLDPRIPVLSRTLLVTKFFFNYPKLLKDAQDENGEAKPILVGGVQGTGIPSVLISDPDMFREILSDTKTFGKPPLISASIETIFGKTILTLEGESWKKERRLLTPLFHFGALKHYTTHFDSLGNDLVEFLRQKNSEPISSPFIREWTLKGVIKSAFGSGIQVDEVLKAEDIISESMTAFIMTRLFLGPLVAQYLTFLPAQRRMKKATQTVAQEVKRLIEKRKSEAKIEGEPNDLVSLLLTSPEHIPEDFITSEGLIFLFAGTDTTSTLLQWCFYELSSHPDVQTKILQEIDEQFSQHPNQPIGDFLHSFVYCRQVLNEALRLRSPVTSLARCATKDTTLGGYKIPQNCIVNLFFHNVHLSPKYFDHPTEFRPERWTNQTDRHPFAFVPFNAGDRNCIGQKLAIEEALIYLIHIVKNFRLEGEKLEQVKAYISVTYLPKDLKVK